MSSAPSVGQGGPAVCGGWVRVGERCTVGGSGWVSGAPLVGQGGRAVRGGWVRVGERCTIGGSGRASSAWWVGQGGRVVRCGWVRVGMRCVVGGSGIEWATRFVTVSSEPDKLTETSRDTAKRFVQRKACLVEI